MTKYVVTLTATTYGRPVGKEYTVEAPNAEAAVQAAREQAKTEYQYALAVGHAEVKEN